MIQHDCGHGSFFRNHHANDWTGRILGVLTLTPYDMWRSTHAAHHATSGNLDKPRIPDVCEALGVPCLTLMSFIEEQAWELRIHPELTPPVRQILEMTGMLAILPMETL